MEGVARPSGTVTFVFTDIEGSAGLWEQHPAAMRAALVRHDELLRTALDTNGGYVFSTAGDGFCTAFSAPEQAVRAALDVQKAIDAEKWPTPAMIRVRIGLHSGTADERGGDYFGPTLNRAARIMGVAGGGEVLASAATVELARGLEREGVRFSELGTTSLRGIGAERVFGVSGPEWTVAYAPRGEERLRLPVVATSIVGRELEVLELCEALSTARMVTLVGSGGIGKTRLAVEVGWGSAEHFGHGVWFVELAPIREPDAVAHTLVAALEVRPLPGRPPTEALVAGLAGQRRLIIVDNCEHLLDEAARVLGELVARCPLLTFLATSRAPLAIAGERVWPLPPLPAQGAAADLFCERARAADAGFTLNGARAAIVELCERLDGIPLAIELAASRSRALSPQELLDRLDDRFRLLRSVRRDAPDRHATLHATVEWSFQLLAPAERTVFERIGVFAGPADLRAIVEVAGDDSLDELDVLEALTTLVDHSLVVAEREGGTTHYRLLDTMRAFTRARLVEHGELRGLAARHARWATTKLESLLEALFGADPVIFEVGRAELERFWPDLRAAVHATVEQGQVDLAMRLVGQFSIEALVSEREELAAWALHVLKLPTALEHPLAPELFGSLAMLDWRAGRFQQMAERLRLGAELRAVQGEPASFCSLEMAEHIYFVVCGEVDRACEKLAMIIAALSNRQPTNIEGWFTIGLAQAECYRGQPQRALQLLADAPSYPNPLIRCLRRWVEGMALVDLDPAAAIPVLRDARSLATAAGATWVVDTASNYLASALAASGDPSEAVTTLQGVLNHAAAGGGVQSLGNTVRNGIALLARCGAYEAVAVLSGWLAAQSLLIPSTAGMRATAAEALGSASAALGPSGFDRASKRGTGLAVADMVAFFGAELALAAGALSQPAATEKADGSAVRLG